MTKQRLLFVEDDHLFRNGLIPVLKGSGFIVSEAATLKAAHALLDQNSFDVALLDKTLDTGESIELIRVLRERYPLCPIIILTGDDNEDNIARYLDEGVDDYIIKGSTVISDVIVRTHHALKRAKQIYSPTNGKRGQLDSFKYEIKGSSPATIALRERILQFKGVSAPILITGETGTGKELVARMLNSIERSGRPLVSINCGALPEALAESELFGHVRGAFTNAHANRIGAFEQAHKGDLFLDEVGELTLQTQVKLLRVLNSGEYSRVGESVTRRADVRIIAATNRSLADLVAEGKFREDLYYRLNVLSVPTTPLRDRTEDIEDIARFLTLKLGKGRLGISDDALVALKRQPFPGNVRELKNMIERAAINSRIRQASCIDIQDLELPHSPSSGLRTEHIDLSPEGFTHHRAKAEATYLRSALAMCSNRDDLAARLGVSRASLFKMIKEHGLGTRSGPNAVSGLESHR